jgi:hypothetical protein
MSKEGAEARRNSDILWITESDVVPLLEGFAENANIDGDVESCPSVAPPESHHEEELVPLALSSSFSSPCSLAGEDAEQCEAVPIHYPTGSSANDDETEATTFSRPEFIYCSVLKPNNDAPVGLFLKSKCIKDGKDGTVQRHVYISRIASNSLFSDPTNLLRVGDRILSVNKVSTDGMKAQDVANLIRASVGTVSITVRNPTGDPSLFGSTVEKPNEDAKVGISLRNGGVRGCILLASRVNANGLFADSLLQPGHRILFLNQKACRNVRSDTASEWIHHREPSVAPRHKNMVTIVSRPFNDLYATVLCLETRTVLQNAIPLAAVAAGAIAFARAI